MILQSFEFSGSSFASSHFSDAIAQNKFSLYSLKRHNRKWFGSCRSAYVLLNDDILPNVNLDIVKSGGNGVKSLFLNRISNELESEELYQKIGVQDTLRTQIGVNHPIPPQPINSRIVGLFALFFFFGVIFEKLWTSINKYKPDVPTSFSLLVEKDLRRKESVEWVNMVLDKFWKVYRTPLENWIIGSLQPVFDYLEKPDFVKRVEIKQFSLGDEPLSVRSVDRITSRRVNDLQYQIGIRYTGGARMLLKLSLKFGIIPVVVPVDIWDFDIDGELWVKLRLIPAEPWVGALLGFCLSAKDKILLVAFPIVQLDGFLTKLLTEDLPRLFVRPNKIDLDFEEGKVVCNDDIFRLVDIQEKTKDFVGELSVTLVNARKLSYFIYGKKDPYVIFNLGDQRIRSKKNSQTTVVGPPGEPIWNQDFLFLVANPRKQKLFIQVKDSFGLGDLTIGSAEVDLNSLQDTVPTDKVVVLQRGWGPFSNIQSGNILLRLTYKAYVEDEDDYDNSKLDTIDTNASDGEFFNSEEINSTRPNYSTKFDKESFMDVLAALLISEEFQRIVASETAVNRLSDRPASSNSDLMIVNPKTASSSLDKSSQAFQGSGLFWYAVITSVSLIIAMNIGGWRLGAPLIRKTASHFRQVKTTVTYIHT